MRTVKRLLILAALLLLGVTFTAHAQENLTETFTAADDSYTFDYPRGWQMFELEDSGSGILMNADATIVVSVFAPAGMNSILGVNDSADIEEALDGVVNFLEGDPTDDPISDRLGGRDVLHVEMETNDADGWSGVIEFSDGGWGGLLATFSRGAPRDRIDTLLAVLETLDGAGGGSSNNNDNNDNNDNQTNDGDTTVYEGDGFGFAYPADWFISDSGSIIIVSNDEDAVNSDFPTRGYAWIALITPDRVAQLSRSDNPEDIFDDILSQLDYDYGRLREVEVGDRVLTSATVDVTDADGVGYVVPFSDEESFGFVMVLTGEGELEDFQEDIDLVLGSFDNEVPQQDNSRRPADGDFPSSLDNFDGDAEDAVAEFVDANVIPEGGEIAFDDESISLDGEVNIIEPIGGRTSLSNFVLSGELTFETTSSSDVEICMFSLRFNSRQNTYIDIGLVNTGTVAMLDYFDPDEDSHIEISDNLFDLDQSHQFTVVVIGEEMTVYVDGDIVFERVQVVEREGGFGVALVGAGRRASCEADNVWVYSLDGLEFSDNGDNGGGDVCTVTPVGNSVNVRSGPGTEFAVQSTLNSGDVAVADGQTTAALGAVWWRLEDGGWVRNDTVEESGPCSDLPTVTP